MVCLGRLRQHITISIMVIVLLIISLSVLKLPHLLPVLLMMWRIRFFSSSSPITVHFGHPYSCKRISCHLLTHAVANHSNFLSGGCWHWRAILLRGRSALIQWLSAHRAQRLSRCLRTLFLTNYKNVSHHTLPLLLIDGEMAIRMGLQSRSSRGTMRTADVLGRHCLHLAGVMDLSLSWCFKSVGPIAAYFALARDRFFQTLTFIV